LRHWSTYYNCFVVVIHTFPLLLHRRTFESGRGNRHENLVEGSELS
jgi:hypothetical protein